jgi:hypothetical protein
MPRLPFPIPSGTALAAVGDPDRDRTVYAAIVLLVALGVGMIMLAVWLLRNTRPDPEVLAPLERMGERKWRRADPVWQRRHLDEVRPGGADPLEPTSAPPATDAEFERGPQPIGFDDLVAASSATVAVASELPAPAPGTMAHDAPMAVDGDEHDEHDALEADPDHVSARYERDTDDTDSRTDADSPGDADAVTDDDEEDEDEDITGEQDTDDFFTVLETDPDTDAEADVDTEAAADVGHDDEAADRAAGDAGEDDHAAESHDRREVHAAGPEDDAPG